MDCFFVPGDFDPVVGVSFLSVGFTGVSFISLLLYFVTLIVVVSSLSVKTTGVESNVYPSGALVSTN